MTAFLLLHLLHFGRSSLPSVLRRVAFIVKYPGSAVLIGEHCKPLGQKGPVGRHLYGLYILRERIVDTIELLA